MMGKPAGARWEMVQRDGISCITIPEWTEKGFVNAFTCRSGGCSSPPFDSLNMALHCGDEDDRVLENRRRLLEVMGLSLASVVCGSQVHGSGVQIVEPHMTGRGALDKSSALPDCDATVCAHPSLTLVSFSADCLLLLFVDPVRRVIANAHSGWKGTSLNIAAQTASTMAASYGSSPRDLEVFIGPGIGPCCFEISGELAEKASPLLLVTSGKRIKEHEGRFYWDLPGTNRDQLLEIGVLPDNIIDTSLCTSCHPELFFSYRREKGLTGRMASLLNLVSK